MAISIPALEGKIVPAQLQALDEASLIRATRDATKRRQIAKAARVKKNVEIARDRLDRLIAGVDRDI